MIGGGGFSMGRGMCRRLPTAACRVREACDCMRARMYGTISGRVLGRVLDIPEHNCEDHDPRYVGTLEARCLTPT